MAGEQQFGPFTVYAPPGVYTRTLFAPNVASITGSVRIPVLIGTGDETLLVSDKEVIRGSSAIADNPIVNEDVSSQLTGTTAVFTVQNFPVVTGDGTGTTSFDPRDVAVTINGEPVIVKQLLGDIGRVTLDMIPNVEDSVLVSYFFKRSDTKVTRENHSLEADGVNRVFKVFYTPIVTGDGGGITTNRPADVTVTVDGSSVSAQSVDGRSGSITLPVAPIANAEVLISYYYNKWQETYDFLPNSLITEVLAVGNGPGRRDYIEGIDFVIVGNTIQWGATARVSAGIHTATTELFDNAKVTTQLVDNRYYLLPATGTKNGVNKVFTLVSTPTDGSGRDIPTGDVTLLKAYIGKTANLAYVAGEVGILKVNSSLRQVTLDTAPKGSEAANLTSIPFAATLTSVPATQYLPSPNAPTFRIASSTEFARLLASLAQTYDIQAGLNDSLDILFDDQVSLLPAPTALTAALAGLGVGNVENGTHSYKVTFVNTYGETEAGTVSSIVTVADNSVDGQIALSAIPVGPAGTTARKIYRTVAGNAAPWKLLTTIADNTTLLFTDNVADGTLGANAPAVNTTQGTSFTVSLTLTPGAARTAAQVAVEINAAVDAALPANAPNACATVMTDRLLLTAFDSGVGDGNGEGPGAAGTASTLALTGNAAADLGFGPSNDSASGVEVNNVLSVRISEGITAPDYTDTDYTILLPAGDQPAAVIASLVNAAIITKGTAVATASDEVKITVTGATGDKKLAVLSSNPANTACATLLGFTGGNASSEAGGAEPFYFKVATNDTFTVTVDGGAPVSITMDVGPNTAQALVDKINSIICPSLGSCDAKAEVANISSTVKGIKIVSQSFGDSSSISLGGTAQKVLGFASPNSSDVGTDPENVYITFYTNLLTDDIYTLQCTLDAAAGAGKYTISESNFGAELALPVLDLQQSKVGDPNFILEQVVFPFDFPDVQSIPDKAIDETVTLTFLTPTRYLVTSTETAGSAGTGELNQTYIDSRTGLRFTIFDPNGSTPELPDGRDMGSAITNPYSFSGEASFARLLSNIPEYYDIVTGLNNILTLTFDNQVGAPPSTVTVSVTMTGGSNRTAAQIATEINAAVDLEFPDNAPNACASVVANRLLLTAFDSGIGNGGGEGPGAAGLASTLVAGGTAASTLGFGAANNFDIGADQDYLTIEVTKPGVFTTGTTPNIQVPGLWTTVNNTIGIGVGDTAALQTYDKTGKEPNVGDFYFISYRYRKTDLGVKTFTKFADVEAEYGGLGPTANSSRVTLGAYLAFLNGAALIAIKQVPIEPGGVDATDQDYIDAIAELEKPLPGGLLPDLVVPLTTSTEVQEFLKFHVIKMSTEIYQGERMAIAGFSLDTDPSEAQEISRTYKAREFVFLYPDGVIVGLNNHLGVLEEFVRDGAFLAAAYAGLDCSPIYDVAEPMTMKQITGLRRFTRRMNSVEMNQTAIAGITVIQDLTPNMIVRHALTTDFSDVLHRETNITKISHFVQRVMRYNLNRYVGQKFLAGLEADIEATTHAVMRALVDAKIITDFTGVSAFVDDTDPTQCNVLVYYRPVFALNYVRVTFNLRTKL